MSKFKQPSKVKCFRCDATDHLANNPLCPARKTVCTRCGIKGHLAKVCRTQMGKQKMKVREIEVTEDTDSDYDCGQVASVGCELNKSGPYGLY